MTDGRLFISHTNEDAAVVDRIVAYLESHGAPCWISSRDIPPRAIYADAITEAMQAASACVVILSATSNTSKAVKRELELASHYDKPFIPIRIDATEPGAGVDYYLRNTQWLDYGRDGDRALDRIVSQGATAASPAPAPRAAQPSRPQPAQSQSQSSGNSWQTIAIIAVVIALLGGAGLYFLNRGKQMQAEQSAADPSLLAGHYNWPGIDCAAGPDVSIDNNQIVFAMAGTPTYRHDIVAGDGTSFDTRVAEPAEHRGETYHLSLGSSGLSVTTAGQTDEWYRCNLGDPPWPAETPVSVADSTWTGTWGEEDARMTWNLHGDGRACGIYGNREVCDWRWTQDGDALTIRSEGEVWSGRLNGGAYSGELRQGHGEVLQAAAPPKPFRFERQN